jgi:hypothetical protein
MNGNSPGSASLPPTIAAVVAEEPADLVEPPKNRLPHGTLNSPILVSPVIAGFQQKKSIRVVFYLFKVTLVALL